MHACTVQSLLRTAEALGVQHVHIVECFSYPEPKPPTPNPEPGP